MTTTPAALTDSNRSLMAAHEYDELIFGGFLCITCTPPEAYTEDPDLTVPWPCPPLREAGVADEVAIAYIEEQRAAATAERLSSATEAVAR